MTKTHALILVCAIPLIVGGCAGSTSDKLIVDYQGRQPSPESTPTFTSGNADRGGGSQMDEAAQKIPIVSAKKHRDTVNLSVIDHVQKTLSSTTQLDDGFANDEKVTVSVEKMPVRDFVHYVFGKVLDVNYIVDDRIESLEESEDRPVTLDLSKEISHRELFDITYQLLLERKIGIKRGDKSFYIFMPKSQSFEPEVLVSIGRAKASVPKTAQRLLQVVPLQYGIKISTENLLNNLLDVAIRPDFDQSALFITGYRDEVLRALDLIEMLDRPASRGAFIGLIELAHMSPRAFSDELILLLENEGVEAAVGKPNQKNVTLVPLKQLSAVAVFAINQALLDRAIYWASVVDVPSQGANEQYFIYTPRYARAIDLGASIGGLFDMAVGGTQAQGAGTGNAPSAQRVAGVSTDAFKMVVDERANALIFFTSGTQYQAILPLLGKLDILPRQVILDITIAEVSLKDEFKFGVEWAMARGEVSLTTLGAFGATQIGGVGLAIDGVIDGTAAPFNANFMATNSLVKVLSNPTLMVRDGVKATINVGSDISVIGETITDPLTNERQTTTSEYRKTGVDVTVTPTINADGIVVMEIEQNISNSVPGSLGSGGNPDIFERSISTEVVARSGETILLGGLISQSSSNSDSGAPGLARIPLLGNLFKSKSDISDRTELIMLVTPRVVKSTDKWDDYRDELLEGLRFLSVESAP